MHRLQECLRGLLPQVRTRGVKLQRLIPSHFSSAFLLSVEQPPLVLPQEEALQLL